MILQIVVNCFFFSSFCYYFLEWNQQNDARGAQRIVFKSYAIDTSLSLFLYKPILFLLQLFPILSLFFQYPRSQRCSTVHCHRGSAERDCQASLLNLIEFVSFSQNMIGFNGFNNCEPRFRGGGGEIKLVFAE